MLKLTGAFLLTGAGLCIGLLKADELKGREKILAAVIRLIAWLRTRLRFTAAPLAELMREAAEEKGFDPLLIPHFPDSKPFAACWTAFAKQLDLSETDRLLLCRFGEEMGRTDLEGQMAHLEMYGSILEERRRQLWEEFRKKGRMTVAVWTAGAAAAALLLL